MANKYQIIIEKIFLDGYAEGIADIPFERDDLGAAAKALNVTTPKNLGDILYSFRYRASMPSSIVDTAPEGQEWVIEGRGRAKYAFKLVPINRILPNVELAAIKIPDATPEIITKYALSDEQALLAKVRYNRLIDIFLGITTYSLQNHLRTTVTDIGQIEIDEVYAGVDTRGRHFIIPVQAKGGSDQLSVVQTRQDITCCDDKFPDLICRAVSAQFLDDDLIALFELIVEDDFVRIAEERHYRLVPASDISHEDLVRYSR